MALAFGRHGQRGHFAGFVFGKGVKRGAGKNHAVVLHDGVVANVAFNFCTAAFDQGAVLFKRLNQAQDAAHVVRAGLAQTFELFVHHHGAYAVVHVNFQQQRAIDRKRNDVAALHARFAGFHAVLQVKRGVGGQLGLGQLRQQLFGSF